MGPVIATPASVQAALYLIVLATNALVAVARGLVAAPGELPLWAPLALATAACAALLIAGTGWAAATVAPGPQRPGHAQDVEER